MSGGYTLRSRSIAGRDMTDRVAAASGLTSAARMAAEHGHDDLGNMYGTPAHSSMDTMMPANMTSNAPLSVLGSRRPVPRNRGVAPGTRSAGLCLIQMSRG